jgi:hypothetical protein
MTIWRGTTASCSVDRRVLHLYGFNFTSIVEGSKSPPLMCEKYPGQRLHVRAIIRDGDRAFLGSQSLRRLELERRREIGLIVDDAVVVRGLRRFFERDWAMTPSGMHPESDERRNVIGDRTGAAGRLSLTCMGM